MTPEIALLLAQDGVTTGAIYVLLALGTVLIFSVTRVIFVPFGDIVAYAALTLAALQAGQLPGTVWLVLTAAGFALVLEAASSGAARRFPSLAAGSSALRRVAGAACRGGLAAGWPTGSHGGAGHAHPRPGAADLAAALPHCIPTDRGCLRARAAHGRRRASFRGFGRRARLFRAGGLAPAAAHHLGLHCRRHGLHRTDGLDASGGRAVWAVALRLLRALRSPARPCARRRSIAWAPDWWACVPPPPGRWPFSSPRASPAFRAS